MLTAQPEQVQASSCCVSLDLKTEISRAMASWPPQPASPQNCYSICLCWFPIAADFPRAKKAKSHLSEIRGITLIMLIPGTPFLFKNPSPVALAINLDCALCTVLDLFLCILSMWGQESRERMPKNPPSWCHTWGGPVSAGGTEEDMSPLQQCGVRWCGTPKSLSARVSQQMAPEAEMCWDAINSKKKIIKERDIYTFSQYEKFCLVLRSWLMFLFWAVWVLVPCRGPTADLFCFQDAVATGTCRSNKTTNGMLKSSFAYLNNKQWKKSLSLGSG